MKLAIITGVTGQDGSYLAEFLLGKTEYKVFGIVRRSSLLKLDRLTDFVKTHANFEVIECDMCDPMALNSILISRCNSFETVEIYNLAAQSHVHTSFEQPWYTFQVNTLGVLAWLEAIRQCPFREKIKFYQAGTSEMFGKVQEVPQNENTSFYPRSPYGVSKVSAYWICKNYKESYGLFVCNGILFNHESERRGDNFVTKKITNFFRNDNGRDTLELGNLDAKRDWGYAPEYVKGMWMMLQLETPDDYVLATGETHSVRDFVNEVVSCMGYNETKWNSDGTELVDLKTTRVLVRTSEKFKRPSEVDLLIGDASKAQRELGWISTTSFKSLVKKMLGFDSIHPGLSSSEHS